MKPQKVKSSNIKSIGYEDGVLAVEYRGTGDTWMYPDVDPKVFRALMRAKSKGRFIETKIKPLYE